MVAAVSKAISWIGDRVDRARLAVRDTDGKINGWLIKGSLFTGLAGAYLLLSGGATHIHCLEYLGGTAAAIAVIAPSVLAGNGSDAGAERARQKKAKSDAARA